MARPSACVSARAVCAAAKSSRPPDSAMRQLATAPDAPKAMGAYSPAIKAGNLLFISGQIPVDPTTGNLIQGDIAAQAGRVRRNRTPLLRAAGASFTNVVRTTVYLADMNDFAGMNEVYSRYIVDPPP